MSGVSVKWVDFANVLNVDTPTVGKLLFAFAFGFVSACLFERRVMKRGIFAELTDTREHLHRYRYAHKKAIAAIAADRLTMTELRSSIESLRRDNRALCIAANRETNRWVYFNDGIGLSGDYALTRVRSAEL